MIVIDVYTFAPGPAGEGTITIPSLIDQKYIGQIINVTRGTILYDPAIPPAGATVSYDGGNTVITLEQTTTYCLSTDELQIQILGTGGGEGGLAADVTVVNNVANPVPISSLSLTSIDGKLPALSDGRVPIQEAYFVSVNNSKSSGGLSSNESWNLSGAGDEILQYGTVTICVFSDQDSATLGLVFEASLDGTNWQTMESYTYKASEGLGTFSMAPSGRYFRVRFVNGSTASTFTRIQTVYRQGYTKSSSHRISDVISGEKDAELVKAVLAAMKPNGTFTDIHATAGGNLKVSVEEVGGTVPVSDNGGSLTVDATSWPLPSGAATEAKQDTLIGHVDGLEGSATSIDSKLPALSGGAVPVTGTINTLTGLDIPKHDNIQLTYTGDNLTGVTYRMGSTTVATLTLAYTGSRLDSITKS